MLAINTAFMTANLALKTPDGKVVLKDIDAKSKHSENVLKTIDQMCEEARCDILDVGSVAVVVGPGSFTGLRIGTAIAKALGCVKNDTKFIAISSLELMAFIAAKTKKISENFVCAINALSDLYFVAYFDEKGIKLQEETMIEKDVFDAINEPIFVLKDDVEGDGLNEIEIKTADFLEFALILEAQKKFVKESELEPVYLRLSQAEANLSKKGKKE